MDNLLPYHPKNLPKLADKTILTLPITISIATPTERISFWQSSTAFWFFCGLVIPTFLIWLALLTANAFYHSVELTKDGHVMFYTFIAMFLFLIGLSYENRNKNFPNPNLFLAKKVKWTTIPMMTIEPQKIVLTDYFKVEKKDLIFDDIRKFYSQGKKKGIPYTGFLVEFKDEKLNKGELKPNPTHRHKNTGVQRF